MTGVVEGSHRVAEDEMSLVFQRTKTVDVEPRGDSELDVRWRVTDTLVEAAIKMRVRLPDLEISEIHAEVLRGLHSVCKDSTVLVAKVVGVRIGPGLRKIIGGLVGGDRGCGELAQGVLECCNAVILHFTVPQLRGVDAGTEEERRERLRAMLRSNPRLVGSCTAFAEDSPLMEGIRPQGDGL